MKCFVMTLKTISTWSNIEIQLPLLKVIEGNRKKLERQITFLNSLMRKSVKSVTSLIFGVNFTFRSHFDPISWTDCDAKFCVLFFFCFCVTSLRQLWLFSQDYVCCRNISEHWIRWERQLFRNKVRGSPLMTSHVFRTEPDCHLIIKLPQCHWPSYLKAWRHLWTIFSLCCDMIEFRKLQREKF